MPEENSMTILEDVLHSRGVVGYVLDLKYNDDGSVSFAAKIGPRGVIVSLNRRTPYLRGDIIYDIADPIRKDEDELNIEARVNDLYNQIANHLSEEDKKRLFEFLDSMAGDGAADSTSCVRTHLYLLKTVTDCWNNRRFRHNARCSWIYWNTK